MANLCSNKLSISGKDPGSFLRFFGHNKNKELENAIPAILDYINDDIGEDDDYNEIFLYFDTNREPPQKWLLSISKQFSTLKFKLSFHELGFSWLYGSY